MIMVIFAPKGTEILLGMNSYLLAVRWRVSCWTGIDSDSSVAPLLRTCFNPWTTGIAKRMMKSKARKIPVLVRITYSSKTTTSNFSAGIKLFYS
jgi:hypothetical protein